MPRGHDRARNAIGEMMAESKAADSKGAAPAPGKDAAKPGEAAGAKKKRNLKPIIMGAVAVLLIGGGAAGYFLTRPKDEPPATAEAGKPGDAKKGEDKDKKGEVKKPFFVEFEPFTVNLKDAEKFLQIKLTFQVKSVDNAEAIKELMPIVRGAVIPVLSSQDANGLMTNEGKEKLTSEVMVAANKSLVTAGMEEAVDAVLITHMIIQ